MSKNRKKHEESRSEKWASFWNDPNPDPFSLHAQKGYEQVRDPDRARSLFEDLDARVEKRLNKTRRPTSLFLRTLFPLGIAASLLVAAFWFVLQKPDPSQLAYAAFDPLPVAGSNTGTRGETTSSADAQKRALAYYESGDYEQALHAFSALEDKSPELALYHGISYLGGKQPGKAANQLERIADQVQPDSDLARAATWYLALSYLADGQVDAAKLKLDELAQSPGDYQREASRLKGEIGSSISK